MTVQARSYARPSLSFVLLSAFVLVLCAAGGSSRADAAGQIVVRGASFILLLISILFADRPDFARARPAWLILLAAAAIPLVQLVPLPPGVWQALPGRTMLAEAATAVGEHQPWRSWAIVPDAAVNAATSLIVPLVVLLLATAIRPAERAWLPGVLLVAVVGCLAVGLLQFSGAGLDNPLVNDTPGTMSGSFANRNHFALFLAMGFPLVATWVFGEGHRAGWRGPVGLGLLLLLLLAILGSGSRAGVALGAIGLVLAALLARAGLGRALRTAPRWMVPAVIGSAIVLVGALVLASVAADRAISFQRTFLVDVDQDMRGRALPTVIEMVRLYFPAGSGLGGFDPIFRIHEPFALLKPTYFNHAHNDFLEIALDAGLPGLVILAAALGWWFRASVGAWRRRTDTGTMRARLGSALLLLVVLASIFDYPARTPIIMAVIAIAATWLSNPGARSASALPRTDQHL